MPFYTFFYCMVHGDGYMLEGKHDSVPDWCKMCDCKSCDSSDWHRKGTIRYENEKVFELEPVFINYDRYGDGFEFRYYFQNIQNEHGEVHYDETSPLGMWFNSMD